MPKIPPAGAEPEVERNIPDTTVAPKQGARIVTEDGAAVGSLVRIFANGATGQAQYFLIKPGSGHKAVPVDWGGEIKDKEVSLLVSFDVLEQMSDFEEASEAASPR